MHESCRARGWVLLSRVCQALTHSLVESNYRDISQGSAHWWFQLIQLQSGGQQDSNKKCVHSEFQLEIPVALPSKWRWHGKKATGNRKYWKPSLAIALEANRSLSLCDFSLQDSVSSTRLVTDGFSFLVDFYLVKDLLEKRSIFTDHYFSICFVIFYKQRLTSCAWAYFNHWTRTSQRVQLPKDLQVIQMRTTLNE